MYYDSINARVHARTNIDVTQKYLGAIIDGQKIAVGDVLFLNDFQSNPDERNVWKVLVDGSITPVLRAMDPQWLVVIEQGLSAANSYRWDPSPGEWVLQSGGTTIVNGTSWYDGTGVPSGTLGVDNDYYINTSTGDIYNKVSGTWVLIANLKGDTGATGAAGNDGASGEPGAAGATWSDGYGAPSSGLGANGDFYLDLSSGNIYQKNSGGVWSVQMNINGSDGTSLHVATQALRDAISVGLLYPGVEVVTEDYSLVWRKPNLETAEWYLVSPQPLVVTAVAEAITDLTATFSATVDGQTLVNGAGYLLPNVTNPGIYFYNSATQKFDSSLFTTSESRYAAGFLTFVRYGTANANKHWKYDGSAWTLLVTTSQAVIGPGTVNYHAKFIDDGYHIGNSIIEDNGLNITVHGGEYLDEQATVQSFYTEGPMIQGYAGRVIARNKSGYGSATVVPRAYQQTSQYAPRHDKLYGAFQLVNGNPADLPTYRTHTLTFSTTIHGSAMPVLRKLIGTMKIAYIKADAASGSTGNASFWLFTCGTGPSSLEGGAIHPIIVNGATSIVQTGDLIPVVSINPSGTDFVITITNPSSTNPDEAVNYYWEIEYGVSG